MVNVSTTQMKLSTHSVVLHVEKNAYLGGHNVHNNKYVHALVTRAITQLK